MTGSIALENSIIWSETETSVPFQLIRNRPGFQKLIEFLVFFSSIFIYVVYIERESEWPQQILISAKLIISTFQTRHLT